MLYKTVELDYKIEDNIPDKVRQVLLDNNAEMSEFQHAFLAGMIKMKRPSKLVEIGVAAGGTTAFIHLCIEKYGLNTEVYSVDKFESYYRNPLMTTGYVIDQMKELGFDNMSRNQHTLLGKSIPYRIDDIGGDIDFLILDTTHALPGELLDYICCMPYLAEDAIVVVHDTSYNLISGKNSFATKLLFDVVNGDKYLCFNFEEESCSGIPNIAAFSYKGYCIEDVRNLISVLSINWEYLLDEEVDEYGKLIHKWYGDELENFFKNIAKSNHRNLILKYINDHMGDSNKLISEWEKYTGKIVLYGAGHWADVYIMLAGIEGLSIDKIVVSHMNEGSMSADKNGIEICDFNRIEYTADECKIIYAIDNKYRNEIEQIVVKRGYTFLV